MIAGLDPAPYVIRSPSNYPTKVYARRAARVRAHGSVVLGTVDMTQEAKNEAKRNSAGYTGAKFKKAKKENDEDDELGYSCDEMSEEDGEESDNGYAGVVIKRENSEENNNPLTSAKIKQEETEENDYFHAPPSGNGHNFDWW